MYAQAIHAWSPPWRVPVFTSRLEPRDGPVPVAAAAAADLDRTRIEELFERLETPLTNAVYRWLWNRDDARDVIQEAFVRLWTMRDRIDWNRAQPLVYRIALNLASKRRRTQALWRWVTFDDAARADESSEPAADPEQEAAVQAAIQALPERQRRVLVLSLHSGLSYEQIGEVLGISPGTVGSRRNTAVRKLREALARWDRKHAHD